MASQERPVEPGQMERIPFLADLEPTDSESLRPILRARDLAPGEPVFEQGDDGSELFLVVDGEVAIEIDAGAAAPSLLTTLGAGAVFGEINFLLGTTRTAGARALRETTVLVLRRGALDRLAASHSGAAAHLMEKLARVLALRLAHVDRQFSELGRRLSGAHPAAAQVVADVERERFRLLHGWSD